MSDSAGTWSMCRASSGVWDCLLLDGWRHSPGCFPVPSASSFVLHVLFCHRRNIQYHEAFWNMCPGRPHTEHLRLVGTERLVLNAAIC